MNERQGRAIDPGLPTGGVRTGIRTTLLHRSGGTLVTALPDRRRRPAMVLTGSLLALAVLPVTACERTMEDTPPAAIDSNTQGRGLELLEEARSHELAGRPDLALDPLREALAIFRDAGDTGSSAETHQRIARMLIALGELSQARSHLRESVRLRRERGEIPRAVLDAAMEIPLGLDTAGPKAVVGGLAELRRELGLLRRAGGQVRVSGLRGHAAAFPPPLPEILVEGATETLPVDGLGGVVITALEGALLDVEANIHTDFGDLAAARETLRHLEAKAREGAGGLYRARANRGRCRIDRREGDLDGALRACRAAVADLERIDRNLEDTRLGLQQFDSDTYHELAEVLEVLGDLDGALEARLRSLETAPANDPCTRAVSITNLVTLEIRRGALGRARTAVDRGIELMARVRGCAGLDAQLLALRSVISLARGEIGGAQRDAEEAIRRAERSGFRPSLVLAWQARLSVDRLLGDKASMAIALQKIQEYDTTGSVAEQETAHEGFLDAFTQGNLEAMRKAVSTMQGRDGSGSMPNNEVALRLLELFTCECSWEEVRTLFDELLVAARLHRSVLEEAVVYAFRGAFAHVIGRTDEAIPSLAEALRLHEEAGLDPSQLLGYIGQVHRQAGHGEVAVDYLERAVDLLDRIARSLRSGDSRLKFYAGGAQGIYRLLVEARVDAGEFEQAFADAEAARQRALLEALAGSRPLAGATEAGTLGEQIAELKDEIRGLERILPVGGSEAVTGPSVRLREAREELLVLLRRRAEALAADETAAGAAPTTLAATRDALRPGETLVSYFYLSDRRLLAWVVRADRTRSIEIDPGRVDEGDVDCLASGRGVEPSEDPLPRSADSIHPSLAGESCRPREAAEHLYAALIGPVRDHLGKGPLLVVSSGLLHRVPFAALLDPATGRFLVEDRPVGYLPSASVLLALRRRQPEGAGRAVVVGVPSREHFEPIPEARREAEEVARLLGARPMLGPQATEARVRRLLSEPGVTAVHIASHGLFDEEESAFSRLYLASDPTSRDDGVFDAHEIAYELALPDAELVTLSGCETGLGETTGGDEVLGLVRAFMVAGSRRVLASRWVVRDAPSARLMIRFYTEIGRGIAPLEALRRAQLLLLRDSATSNPADWAAFMLVGDPAPWIPTP